MKKSLVALITFSVTLVPLILATVIVGVSHITQVMIQKPTQQPFTRQVKSFDQAPSGLMLLSPSSTEAYEALMASATYTQHNGKQSLITVTPSSTLHWEPLTAPLHIAPDFTWGELEPQLSHLNLKWILIPSVTDPWNTGSIEIIKTLYQKTQAQFICIGNGSLLCAKAGILDPRSTLNTHRVTLEATRKDFPEYAWISNTGILFSSPRVWSSAGLYQTQASIESAFFQKNPPSQPLEKTRLLDDLQILAQAAFDWSKLETEAVLTQQLPDESLAEVLAWSGRSMAVRLKTSSPERQPVLTASGLKLLPSDDDKSAGLNQYLLLFQTPDTHHTLLMQKIDWAKSQKIEPLFLNANVDTRSQNSAFLNLLATKKGPSLIGSMNRILQKSPTENAPTITVKDFPWALILRPLLLLFLGFLLSRMIVRRLILE
jgi:hypothetical protein